MDGIERERHADGGHALGDIARRDDDVLLLREGLEPVRSKRLVTHPNEQAMRLRAVVGGGDDDVEGLGGQVVSAGLFYFLGRFRSDVFSRKIYFQPLEHFVESAQRAGFGEVKFKMSGRRRSRCEQQQHQNR